jgi:hypothetical protein
MDDVSFGEPSQSSSEPQVQEAAESIEGLASPFLAKIPAQDRAIVGKYIKDWDAGVTKRFQEYSGKLKPYEALGPIEELERWRNLHNNFRANPEGVFRIMYEGLQQQYGEDFEQQLVRILGLEEEGEMSDEQGYYEEEQQGGEEYDENEVFQQNVISELEELRAWRDEQMQAQASQMEEAQLDQVLTALHQRYGDFDDEGVLIRIAAHGDPHKAVQEWRQMVSKYSQNGPQRQAPKVMGGQGGVPSEQVDAKSLRGEQRKALVAQMLAGLQEGQ